MIGLLDAETHTTPLSLAERESLITDVLHELFGLGPLEALLADPTVSDILVNRSNSIYVERNGKLEETPLTFKDDQHLLRIIERIVRDRKSTRLNSSHGYISYAVFCLKKK